MSERTCSVEDCDEKVHARDLCHRHYGRWRTRGSTEDLIFEARTCVIEDCDKKVYAKDRCQSHYRRYQAEKDRESGKIFPECSVEGCDRRERHLKRGLCDKHYRRWFRYGDVTVVNDVVRGEDHHLWNGGTRAYYSAHQRVRNKYGSATDHLCSACLGPAVHWAYDHEDPDEKTDDVHGSVYSDKIDHYFPLCSPCHVEFDQPWRTDPTASCETCGEVFVPYRDNHVFCSDRCKRRARTLRDRSDKAKPVVTCEQCGTTFTQRHKLNRFCSGKCAERARYLRRT